MGLAIFSKKKLRDIFDNANRCLYVTIGMKRKTAHTENQYFVIHTIVDDWLYQHTEVGFGCPMNDMELWKRRYVF